jgi:hypothetical protein
MYGKVNNIRMNEAFVKSLEIFCRIENIFAVLNLQVSRAQGSNSMEMVNLG